MFRRAIASAEFLVAALSGSSNYAYPLTQEPRRSQGHGKTLKTGTTAANLQPDAAGRLQQPARTYHRPLFHCLCEC